MLDFQKAFDSLEWNFIYKALEMFNIGESFIHWIKTLYRDPQACIKNNGHLSRSVHLERSIRQGCPVSCLLFIIAVEVMAIAVRQNENLAGLKIGDNTDAIKIVQYADDGILFANDEFEITEGLNTITKFGDIAGPVLNITKCECLWLGNFKFSPQNCAVCNIKWTDSPL